MIRHGLILFALLSVQVALGSPVMAPHVTVDLLSETGVRSN